LALFGLGGLDDISHALFWSMLANVGGYVAVSMLGRQGLGERAQAQLFVDVFTRSGQDARPWRGSASVQEVVALITRFLGSARADAALAAYAAGRGWRSVAEIQPDAELVRFSENLLAGAIGASSARVMVASVVEEEPLGMDEVLNILDEASQVLAYSHRLEQKSRELEAATSELRAANARLQELDRMKDDFISTVTHELRTPLTSIRAMSETLQARPRMDEARRMQFISIIVKESERLTRLINQMLDLAKLESGGADWHSAEVDLKELIEDAASSTAALLREHAIALTLELPPSVPVLRSDRDRLMQVLLNLISNAAKFCPRESGRITIALQVHADRFQVDVRDNGIGIAPADQELIFEKFRQVGDTLTGKPQGTGLGLPISRQIIEHLGGRLWVVSAPGRGATFSFTLPLGARPAPESAGATGQATNPP
jgi:signal transduction histidine kinase